MMLRIPAHQLLLSLMIYIDLVTEVQFYHSICAQFQYSAEVCRTFMQHIWVLAQHLTQHATQLCLL